MLSKLLVLIAVCHLAATAHHLKQSKTSGDAMITADTVIPPDLTYSGPSHPGMVVSNGIISPESIAKCFEDMNSINPGVTTETVRDEDADDDDSDDDGDDYDDEDENSSESVDKDTRGIMKLLKRIMTTQRRGTAIKDILAKRITMTQTDRIWPQAVVPYTFGSLAPSKTEDIKQAFQIFHKYSCVRFYEWHNKLSTELSLQHQNYLEFFSGSGCSSVVGMSPNNKAQKISCCGAGVCVHELGHALGFIHEQQNPLRDDYIRVNLENVKTTYHSAYSKRAPGTVLTTPWKYDLTSVMHYGLGAFGTGSEPTMTMRDPLTTYLVKEGDTTYYYFIRELEALYNCRALKCPDDTRMCENDGYLTYQDNQCICRCIHGLDPVTNCVSLLKQDQRLYTSDWPAVKFALLKAKDVPCPEESVEGTLTHFGLSSWTANRHDADGAVTKKYTTMKFCTFSNLQRSGETLTFSPGQYCINRVEGLCPDGFTPGHMKYDSTAPPETSGSVPDGTFNDNTLIEFCCRNDGNFRIPIELPLKQRFILWRTSNAGCQEVKDAISLGTQYFGFKNPKGSSIADVQEPVPLSYHTDITNVWLYYCVYQPITKGCGAIIELTDDAPTSVIQSPNYPDPYNQYSECTWVVRSPANSSVVLDFSDFIIPNGGSTTSCEEDELEIRFNLPGQPGLRLCGNDYKISTVSETNISSITLHSMGPMTAARRFEATVKFVRDDELCYKTSDKGATYRGRVNFAKDMKICLPWRDVSHCPHNVFEYSDFYDGLDENYCRTPGPGLRPFCYTAAEGCVPNYCDVCGVGSCFDINADCFERFKDDNSYCSDNKHIGPDGTIGCAATCDMCGRRIEERADTITCATPTLPSDGTDTETLKNIYTVGEVVHAKCRDNPNYSGTYTCTTSGSWDGPLSACQGCPTDWILLNGVCYKYFPTFETWLEANQTCAMFEGGTLFITEDIDLVYEVMNPNKVVVWIGLSDITKEGTFMWNDNTPLDTTKLGASWKPGQPNDNDGQEDCVEVNKSKKLLDQNCDLRTRPYVCQAPLKVPTVCKDARSDCGSIQEDFPEMCNEHKLFAELACRVTCGICEPSKEPCAT